MTEIKLNEEEIKKAVTDWILKKHKITVGWEDVRITVNTDYDGQVLDLGATAPLPVVE